MTIPVSSVVGVSIAISQALASRPGFGTLLIVTREIENIGVAERVRSYSSMSEVDADWTSENEVYPAAQAYFAQVPKPTSLKIGVRFEEDQPAVLRGGSFPDNAANTATLEAISDGTFDINVNGTDYSISGLDFSGIETVANANAIIQAELTAEAVPAVSIYNSDEGRFYIETSAAGDTSTISFATDTGIPASEISSLLQLQQGQATKANGIDAETVSSALSAIDNIDPDWYGFAFTSEFRDDYEFGPEGLEEGVLDAAAWADARTKVFFNTTNDLDVYDSVQTNDIGSQLQALNSDRTLTVISSSLTAHPAISIAGRAFTVDFNQPDSTITLKFKQGPGVFTETINSNQKSVMDSKNVNAFIDVGGNQMFAEGVMASGKFFDTIHGVDWLASFIQTEVFAYLYSSTTKAPGTDKGISGVEQRVIKALDQARSNGLIAPGVDVNGDFLAQGYKVTVIPKADLPSSEVDNREFNAISFVALGAGAIHGTQISGTFE